MFRPLTNCNKFVGVKFRTLPKSDGNKSIFPNQSLGGVTLFLLCYVVTVVDMSLLKFASLGVGGQICVKLQRFFGAVNSYQQTKELFTYYG